MNFKKKIIKKRLHRVIWRSFTILLGIFFILFFFGAYVFYTNDTDYSQRNFDNETDDLYIKR